MYTTDSARFAQSTAESDAAEGVAVDSGVWAGAIEDAVLRAGGSGPTGTDVVVAAVVVVASFDSAIGLLIAICSTSLRSGPRSRLVMTVDATSTRTIKIATFPQRGSRCESLGNRRLRLGLRRRLRVIGRREEGSDSFFGLPYSNRNPIRWQLPVTDPGLGCPRQRNPCPLHVCCCPGLARTGRPECRGPPSRGGPT